MRKMVMAAMVLGLCGFGASGPAHAVRILGHGTDKCTEWLKNRDGNLKNEYREWILGYLSASAFLKNQDVLRNMSYAAVLKRVDEDCERRPQMGIDEVLDRWFN
jgi:hypothetical protein